MLDQKELVAEWVQKNYISWKNYPRPVIKDHAHCRKLAERMIRYPDRPPAKSGDVSGMMMEILFLGLSRAYFYRYPVGIRIDPVISNNITDYYDGIDVLFQNQLITPLGVDIKSKQGTYSILSDTHPPRAVLQLGGNEVTEIRDVIGLVVSSPGITPEEIAQAHNPNLLRNGLFGVLSGQVEKILDFNGLLLPFLPFTEEVLIGIGNFGQTFA